MVWPKTSCNKVVINFVLLFIFFLYIYDSNEISVLKSLRTMQSKTPSYFQSPYWRISTLLGHTRDRSMQKLTSAIMSQLISSGRNYRVFWYLIEDSCNSLVVNEIKCDIYLVVDSTLLKFTLHGLSPCQIFTKVSDYKETCTKLLTKPENIPHVDKCVLGTYESYM